MDYQANWRIERACRSIELTERLRSPEELCCLCCNTKTYARWVQLDGGRWTDKPAADLIQDMYLKSLREYKAPPQKASDAEGQVQKFTPPAAPKSPEEANLANDMKAYEDQVVEIEGQASAGETQEPEEDYFEDLKHIDGKLTTGEAHH